MKHELEQEEHTEMLYELIFKCKEIANASASLGAVERSKKYEEDVNTLHSAVDLLNKRVDSLKLYIESIGLDSTEGPRARETIMKILNVISESGYGGNFAPTA